MMEELARLLGYEGRLLELLLFQLLATDVSEVERAMARVQEAELRRSILIHDLARALDLPDEALTMSALAENCVEPYRTIFADHRRDFLDLAAEIEQANDGLGTACPAMPSLVDFLAQP